MSGELAEAVAARHRMAGARETGALWTTTLLALGGLAIAMIALFWHEAAGAVRVWYGSAAYNHGFLIIPISAYLIWERRGVVAGVAPRPCLWVLPLLPAIGLVWLIAHLIGLLEAEQMLVLCFLQVTLFAVLGYRVFRLLAFPFLFLFFLVPTGEFLVPYLQDFTARFTVAFLRFSNIPVYSDGFLISIPNANFYVAEACAGLRFLIATIAFGVLFSEFFYRSWTRRIAFILLCTVAPVIANGFRAYGIILLAWLTDGELAAGVDHILYGWIFFSLVTVGLMAIGYVFRQRGAGEVSAGPDDGAPAASPQWVLMTAGLALALIAAPRAYAAYLEHEAATAHRPTGALPAVTAPWTAAPTASRWHPVFATADLTLQQSYAKDGAGPVDLFIAYYARQSEERKLVAFANRLVDGKDMEISDRATATVAIDGEAVPVAVTYYGSGGHRRAVMSVYWVDGRFEASPLKTKLRQAKAEIAGGQRASAVVAMSSELGAFDLGSASAALADFAAHLRGVKAALEAMSRS